MKFPNPWRDLIVEYIPWIVGHDWLILAHMKRTYGNVQKDLAQNLKELRDKSSMSQESLALAAEVDRTYVSQIERGIGNPSVKVIVKLANCFGADISELLRPRRR
jgi:DNA-binding XRE family transcriptional regulator